MIRYDCFEWLAPQMKDELVVTSLSGQRVEWGHLSKRDADLTLGSMGNALAVGMGLAWRCRTERFSFSSRTEACSVSVQSSHAARQSESAEPAVFVFDNQAYTARGSVPSGHRRQDGLAAIGKGAGIEHSVTIRELEDFKREASGALKENGLRFVVCKIEESVGHRKIVRSNVDLLETKYRFVRYLERTENKPIFLGRG